MEISIREFLIQLGPEFIKYEDTFLENEFNDSSSLRAMEIDQDLDTIFSESPLPLGHKRKIQMAVKNLNSATRSQDSEISATVSGPHVTSYDNTVLEKSDNMSRIKDKILNDIKLKEHKKVSKKRALEVTVSDPDPVGPFKNTRCGNCHMRVHKADGNKGNKSCSLPPCDN